jgi:hypothetical protein
MLFVDSALSEEERNSTTICRAAWMRRNSARRIAMEFRPGAMLFVGSALSEEERNSNTIGRTAWMRRNSARRIAVEFAPARCCL